MDPKMVNVVVFASFRFQNLIKLKIIELITFHIILIMIKGRVNHDKLNGPSFLIAKIHESRKDSEDTEYSILDR